MYSKYIIQLIDYPSKDKTYVIVNTKSFEYLSIDIHKYFYYYKNYNNSIVIDNFKNLDRNKRYCLKLERFGYNKIEKTETLNKMTNEYMVYEYSHYLDYIIVFYMNEVKDCKYIQNIPIIISIIEI